LIIEIPLAFLTQTHNIKQNKRSTLNFLKQNHVGGFIVINIDMINFVNEAFKKYVLQRAARYFDGDLKLQFDGSAYVITFKNGTPVDVKITGADVPADLFINATDEQWKKMLSVSPPPFYNSLFIGSMYHGFKISSGVKALQYKYLLDELLRQLRAFYNNDGFVEVDPLPVKPNVRTEPVIGRYIYIVVDGIEYRVYYEEAGQGIPFLLQHTAGANNQEYRFMMNDPELTKDFRFIAHDLPYHGKSLPPENYPWWNNEYKLTLDFLLKFYDAFINALQLHRPAYMGCSMGGHLAADLAYYCPEKFRATVGIGAALATASEVTDDKANKMAENLKWRHDNPQVSNMEIATTNEAVVALKPYATQNTQREVGWDYGNAYPGIYAGDCYYYSFDHNLTGKAQDIDTTKCALYLLTGTYDPGTPPYTTQALADQVKGSKLTFMEGVGHYAMLEAYPTFKKYFMPIAEEIKTLK
jgi:pimeloyl-ACP methyl ester carboxylesterase